jgi:chromosome segregation ATPase
VTEEPASLILELLRQMRAELGDVRSEIREIRADSATKSDLSTLRAEILADMHTLRADVAADILSTRKELGEQIMGLRRAVMEYHTSVIGHGSLISELEARVRRVEQHLNLPSLYPT